MADIRATQARVRSVQNVTSEATRITQARVRGIYNFPSDDVRISQARVRSVMEREGEVNVTQARIRVVGRGRVDNHTVRCWRMPLDTHDLYIVRLGETSTLVYDRSTGVWSEWSSPDLDFWRANIGTSWLGLKRMGATTDIVAGDDTFGLLWIVDTDAGTDQHPVTAEELQFDRIVTGMVPMRMRGTQPCNAVYLTADTGYDAGTSWTLRTSDDQGKNWTNHGTVTTRPGDWNQEVSWRALGNIRAPGRLFELSDNGASARVNSLDMTS